MNKYCAIFRRKKKTWLPAAPRMLPLKVQQYRGLALLSGWLSYGKSAGFPRVKFDFLQMVAFNMFWMIFVCSLEGNLGIKMVNPSCSNPWNRYNDPKWWLVDDRSYGGKPKTNKAETNPNDLPVPSVGLKPSQNGGSWHWIYHVDKDMYPLVN